LRSRRDRQRLPEGPVEFGYDAKHPCTKQTISTWMGKAKSAFMGIFSCRRPRKKSHSQVPEDVQTRVEVKIRKDADAYNKTNVDFVIKAFAAEGYQVSNSYARWFFDIMDFGLRKAQLRSRKEVDNVEDIKGQITRFWQTVQTVRTNEGVKLTNMVGFDEIPVYYEKNSHKVYRERGKAAFVIGYGGDKKRVTVINCACRCHRSKISSYCDVPRETSNEDAGSRRFFVSCTVCS
jgi:hypothetical protein